MSSWLDTLPATPAKGALALGATRAGVPNQLWVQRFNGPANGNDAANSEAVSPDGSKVFVTGLTPVTTGVTDYATVAYNAATGTQLWVKRYNGPGNSHDGAESVAVSPAGSKVFVTGWSTGAASGDDYATVAYNAATGQRLWVKRYNGPGNGDDISDAMAVNPAGTRVYVTGSSDNASAYATVAYNTATGRQLWLTRYTGNGIGPNDARGLALSPDGSKVFVTGVSWGDDTTGLDYATLAYGATAGAQLWAKRYVGYMGSFDLGDVPTAVAVSPDGTKVFITGESYGGPATSRDYATVAYGF